MLSYFTNKHIYTSLIAIFVLLTTKATGQNTLSYKESVALEITNNNITNTKATLEKPYVIMVSIDGFRYDYATKHNAKNILDLAKNGSSVTRLIPSFPSKTFPNHYSIITGLYPEHHGIVSNSFLDKANHQEYKISNRAAVENGKWYGGTPLWNLAQQQGMCTASYFWVGSEANINNMHPTYYYKFDKQRPYEYRVKRVLEWLQLPEEKRPHFITMYFSMVDTEGHHNGPDATATKEAVQYVDEQIGELRKQLAKLNLPVYLIVTSDHGMDTVSEEINLHDYVTLDPNAFYGGTIAMVYTKNSNETNTLYNTLTNIKGLKVYKENAVPNYLNFKDNSKIGDLVLIADAPNIITYRETPTSKPLKAGGNHGYDPFYNTNMSGIFYIEGPTIKKGYTEAPVENVHIYPLIAHILGLEITSPIDGNLNALIDLIKK